MEVTQFHIDQADSMFRLTSKPTLDLIRLRKHFSRVLPLAQNHHNRRDTQAIISAIDGICSRRAA